jgi:hypothetical protein
MMQNGCIKTKKKNHYLRRFGWAIALKNNAGMGNRTVTIFVRQNLIKNGIARNSEISTDKPTTN